MKAEKMKLGLVGLGQRGSALLNDIFIPSERVEVAAVCDIYQDRIDAVVQKVTKAGQKAPFTTQNYKELIDKDKVDLVVVASPWKEHIPMVLYALEKGIPCGSEVGGAESLDECFSLVDTWERTRTPYMFLENCCYGRREMMVLNMVKKAFSARSFTARAAIAMICETKSAMAAKTVTTAWTSISRATAKTIRHTKSARSRRCLTSTAATAFCRSPPRPPRLPECTTIFSVTSRRTKL